MKITMKLIKSLKPCEGPLKSAEKHYAKRKSVTPAQFLGLKNIPHKDKLWVSLRLMKKEHIRFAAAEIARLVLPIFEAKYPNDLRPRQAIEAAESNTLSKDEISDATSAAYAAAFAAEATTNAEAAAYAAYFASYAATSAAYAASDAASDAEAAAEATTSAAEAAAYTAASMNKDNRVKIEKKIRTILLKYLNKE
jgi:hypothetical protein